MNADGHKLWFPKDTSVTRTHAFMERINAKYALNLASYEELWRWSVEDVSRFWEEVWDETGVIGEKGGGAGVSPSASAASNPAWFPAAKLNWAENMLQRRDDKIALIEVTEPTPAHPKPPHKTITYKALYDLTSRVLNALKKEGIKPGDRVASYSSNCIENVAAALATAALGGIWVSVSADFGADAALSRFQQVQPQVLFTVSQTVYNAKVHPHLPKLANLLADLPIRKPKVVIVGEKIDGWKDDYVPWDDFLEEPGEIGFFRTGFDWPLWILFSSGTTNKPKPIVHRAGGMLLQSKKEFIIHADLTENDVFFYYTTTGWMMWNFLINALSVGCTLVLYDGSPLKDPSFLWRLSEELRMAVFGTSAKYLDQLSRDYKPQDHHDLSSLKQIYSTGSPLASHLFDYVYESISPDVILGSITGGTDICSLFAGMCTALPVYRGELQCRMLGMAIESFGPDGKSTLPGESGELVCTKSFPCQPLGFWPLEGFGDAPAVAEAQDRYKQSYFDEFDKQVWYHGDHILITPSREGNGGGVVMLGRSDGVLNPGGIRFGSSEVYNVIDACFSTSAERAREQTIVDSLVVGQSIQGGTDERVILFVKLHDDVSLTPEFVKEVKTRIRSMRTARHVPEKVLRAPDIPYTLNAKKVEVPIKKIMNGVNPQSLNLSTLRNPECLEYYVNIGEELRREL